MTDVPRGVRWYSSFYWRIGISFVFFVAVLLVGQGLMVGYARTSGAFGPGDAFGPGNPNGTAITMAARLGHALETQPDLDISRYLLDNFGEVRQAAYVVLSDGRTGATSAQPLSPAIGRQVRAALDGVVPAPAPDAPAFPAVMAPVQVDRRLAGLVILPPPRPRGMMVNVGELLTLPGTLGLIIVSAIAALVIFGPARNRLRALEGAAQRLGAGELEARAPVTGRDEVARVAAAFNQMAGELQIRTEALRTSNRLRRQMLADISHELRTPLTTMRAGISRRWRCRRSRSTRSGGGATSRPPDAKPCAWSVSSPTCWSSHGSRTPWPRSNRGWWPSNASLPASCGASSTKRAPPA